jgi:hypothetical protein
MATDPMTAPKVLEKFAAAVVAVASGIATNYWLELKAYPPGSARSLWLFVDNSWRHLDNPSDGIQASVQAAFCNCPNVLQVQVWYQGDVIVGLVVNKK